MEKTPARPRWGLVRTYTARALGSGGLESARHFSEDSSVEGSDQPLLISPNAFHISAPFSSAKGTTSLDCTYAVVNFPQKMSVKLLMDRAVINVAVWPISRASLSAWSVSASAASGWPSNQRANDR